MSMIYCAGLGGDNQSCGRKHECAKWRPWWEGPARVEFNLCRSIQRDHLVAFAPKGAAIAPPRGQQELFA